MIYRFLSLGSTNDEAQSDKYTHGDIIAAEFQSAGRGQRGNVWLSDKGDNLTFSVVLQPTAVAVRDQFIISQVVALSLCDLLRAYGIEARIKWTNDIYVGERKIVGILIENRLSGGHLARSVVGVGLNVNQREFDPKLPNPTSMILEGCVELDRDDVLGSFESLLLERYNQIAGGNYDDISAEYQSLMYRRGEEHTFRLPGGELRQGVIQGVEKSGELIITWSDGQKGSYLFGEVEFVIESRKR